MQTAEERRRLMDRRGADSNTPLVAVLVCAAGILVLVIVAAAPWALLSAGGPAVTHEAQPAKKLGAAQAESKRIFDERRGAYEGVRDGDLAGASNATRTSLTVE